MLRIKGRNKNRVRMDRLGEYIRDFALLLGTENKPVFKGIKNASVGLMTEIDETRSHYARLRLVKARDFPDSKEGKVLERIQNALNEDGVKEAEILDSSNNVIYTFHGSPANDDTIYRATEQGEVDGVVTGIKGVDDTMHLYLRDHAGRDVTLLLRDETLARDILKHYRAGILRFTVDGTWIRGDDGWLPEASKCIIQSFEVLNDTSLTQIFEQLRIADGNGWTSLPNSMATWADIRGIQH